MSNQTMPTFGSRFVASVIPRNSLPDRMMDPRAAYHLIRDELQVQGNPTLNMASFCTTVMEEECDRLIAENLGINYIDTKIYRSTLEIQNRCIAILADLYNAPDPSKAWGTQCGGSSEALLLAVLTHKRAWQEKRKATGKACDRPNIVMGNDVHLTWIKAANFLEVEARLIRLHPNRYTITAEEVMEKVDENTICVAGVLGTSYTFDFDPIKKINDALVDFKNRRESTFRCIRTLPAADLSHRSSIQNSNGTSGSNRSRQSMSPATSTDLSILESGGRFGAMSLIFRKVS